MIKSYFLTDEALEDIRRASIWYENKKFNLGDEFQTEVFKSINIIC